MLLLVGAALAPGCSDEEVNVAPADAGADRDAAGGSGGREAGPDAPLDAPADRQETDVVDAPPGPLAIC